jgi:SAM-dependent methyltransferase
VNLRRLQRTWDEWGSKDPLYVILVDEAKRGGRWDKEEFFRSGEREIEGLLAALDGLGIELKRGRALDFGCGVGRLTQALSLHFLKADGVDIAPSMVRQAREWNRFPGVCEYHVNSAADLKQFPSAAFDLIYSSIVLQHMEPRFAEGYIREFIRLLAPCGIAVFQAPSAISGEGSNSWRRRLGRMAARLVLAARSLGSAPPSIHMHAVPRARIEALVAECGAELVAAAADGSAGPEWTSHRYFVRRS